MPRSEFRGTVAVALVLAACVALPSRGRADEAQEGIHLQAESGRRVANDRMEARLAVELENVDPARLADEVNETMDWALGRAKRAKGVIVQSGAYQTRPIFDEQRIRRWHARQELILESGDTDRLSELLGELQSRLQLQGVAFRVSRGARQRVEEELIAEALDAFKRRAELVRKNLGADGYRIAELYVGTPGGPAPRARAMGRAMAESVAAPGFEAGTSDVTVQVRGRIVLD